MIIDIGRLPEGGESLEGEVPAGVLGLESGAGLAPMGPILCKIRVDLVTGELLVKGRLAIEMAVNCSRCAEETRLLVEDSRFECAIEVNDSDESVDLTPEIRESILLALPSYPLCGPECKGLCPKCGKNLNSGPCACRSTPVEGLGALGGIAVTKV